MKNILVINTGSTSVKYKLFGPDEKQLKQGCFNNMQPDKAIKEILREVGDLGELDAIGHRVVHGGDKYIEPVVATEEIIKELEEYNFLAPLHNPFNLAALKASSEFLPNVKQVAVFDTAFYADLPMEASKYALPAEIIKKFNIKRYGFHGLSHNYVLLEAAKELKKNPEEINLISCHLGGGWSITAMRQGKAIDTSMGWTPLEGLIMMTRAGDIDPSIVVNLIKNSDKDTTKEKCEEVYDILNKESGLKALSGGTSDYKELIREVSLGNEQSKLALDIAIYKLVKYIGAYWAVLEGSVEAIVFTGAVGAGIPLTREKVMNRLKYLGEVKVLAIKPDEELMIAREVKKIVSL